MPCENLRFLVVEDHPVQRRVLCTLLRNFGAEVVYQAEDGMQALEVIRDPVRPVDIVISDVLMPGMDGLELVRNMAGHGAAPALIITSALSPPVLASVANTAVSYKVRLLGVIGKPVSAVKLVPLVAAFRKARERSDTGGTPVAELANALSRGEFEPRYEPKARIETGEIVGFHVRPFWRHPQRGLLGPEDFLRAAETSGLLEQVLASVLRKGLEPWSRWSQAGVPHELTFSLGDASVAEADLARRVPAVVREAQVPPQGVVLSVGEAAVDTDRPQALEALVRLRAAGFGVAIEEFGTRGLRSRKLARVPVTQLTLSASLVRAMHADKGAEAGLVNALDRAAHLRLPTVAEGVEAIDDWNLLQGWGCTFGVGPFVGPPLAADDVLPWLQVGRGKVMARGPLGRRIQLEAGEDA